MSLSFSQRMGFKPIRLEIQRESVDSKLRNVLWNGLYIFYFKKLKTSLSQNGESTVELLFDLWMNHYDLNYDDMESSTYNIMEKIKTDFIESPWYQMFDLLEFIPNHYYDKFDNGFDNKVNLSFFKWVNIQLEKYLSAYRFIDKHISEISSNEEIATIENALNNKSKESPVQIHLKRALELFSDRENPDYRNSIKESISAVEAYCKVITGDEKATLGKALAVI